MANRLPKVLNWKEKEILRKFTEANIAVEKQPHEFTGAGGKEEYLSIESLTSIPSKRFTLDIFAEPKPKQRPRGSSNGKFYTPAQTTEAEARIGWLMKARYPGLRPDGDHAFGIRLLFRCSAARGRPADIDNLTKLVLDGLNGILWADDSQVEEVTARVVRSREHVPSTRIFAYTIEATKQEDECRKSQLQP